MSTFGSKIRKLGIPLQTSVFYIKVGFSGVYISQTCFPDVNHLVLGVLSSVYGLYIIMYIKKLKTVSS